MKAAFLASLVEGYWKNVDELKDIFVVGKTFESQMRKAKREYLYQGWKHAVKATQVFVFPVNAND